MGVRNACEYVTGSLGQNVLVLERKQLVMKSSQFQLRDLVLFYK